MNKDASSGQTFEVLPHTADYKIRAYGRAREELFVNAMRGMFAGYQPKDDAKPQGRNIRIQTSDLSQLLVEFLSEALVLSDSHNEVYTDVRFSKLTDAECVAELAGHPLATVEGDEIKAVTYHGLEVKQRPDGIWEATIVFDI